MTPVAEITVNATFDNFHCKMSKVVYDRVSMEKEAPSQLLKFMKAYLRGQLLLSLVLALLYSLGFGLVCLPGGYYVGFGTGMLSWVPFFGTLIGFTVAMIIVGFHFAWPLFFKVCGVYVVCQLLEGFFLAPRILGKTLGLNFWQALGAVIVGALAFGPLGATLALPVAAFLKYMIDQKAQKKVERKVEVIERDAPFS